MLSRRLLRTKVVKAVYAHTQCEGLTPAVSEKNLVLSIDRAYDLYFHLLALVPEIAEYAAERIRIGENKKLPTYDDLHPNRKFVENKVIARLAEDENLQAEINSRKLSWKNHRDLIVALYNALIRQTFYQKYMANEERSFREDAQLVSDIYMTMLEEFEPLESALEEQSILWNESEQMEIEVVGTINRKNKVLLACYRGHILALLMCVDSLHDLCSEYSSAQHNFKELYI